MNFHASMNRTLRSIPIQTNVSKNSARDEAQMSSSNKCEYD